METFKDGAVRALRQMATDAGLNPTMVEIPIGPLINVKNLVVGFPSDEGFRTILNVINLKVRQGEFLTLVGPSGCGKSTLLRAILGSQFPTSGEVLVGGKAVERVSRDCGIVYQKYSLFPQLTVLENVMLGLILENSGLLERAFCKPFMAVSELLDSLGRFMAGSSGNIAPLAVPGNLLRKLSANLLGLIRLARIRGEARDQAADLLLKCGLNPGKDGDKYPQELSGGMQQRVAIAQALIMKPKILLMDEPFGALDKSTREEMQDFIHAQWLEHKLTVFFVTHDLPEACKLGTRLVCLSQYWKENNGDPGIGAKIMIDKPVIGGMEKPSRFGKSDDFKELVDDINLKALNRQNAQPISAFELTHPDASSVHAEGGK